MSHKMPDRFSRFDVYWMQTNRHPDAEKPNLYIEGLVARRDKEIQFWLKRENENYVAIKLQ